MRRFSPEEWVDLWCSVPPPPGPQMLRYLEQRTSALWPGEMARSLGRQARGGHWNSGLALLRRNGLIDEDSKGRIRLRQDMALSERK